MEYTQEQRSEIMAKVSLIDNFRTTPKLEAEFKNKFVDTLLETMGYDLIKKNILIVDFSHTHCQYQDSPK